MENMEILRGDIFFMKQDNFAEPGVQAGERPVVVVSNNKMNATSPSCIIVPLTTADKKPLPTHCTVKALVPSTALCENVRAVSNTRLTSFVRCCSEEELERLDKALAAALALTSDPAEQVTKAADPAKELAFKAQELKLQIMATDNKALTMERDFYRQQYRELLDRLIK